MPGKPARPVVRYAGVSLGGIAPEVALGPAGTCTEYLLGKEPNLRTWTAYERQRPLDSSVPVGDSPPICSMAS